MWFSTFGPHGVSTELRIAQTKTAAFPTGKLGNPLASAVQARVAHHGNTKPRSTMASFARMVSFPWQRPLNKLVF